MAVEDWIIFIIYFIIGYLVAIILIVKIKEKISGYKKRDFNDTNIEWYGPDIYLKEKDYGYYDDDFREELIDRDNYIAQEKRRSENVKKRDNGSDSESTTSIGD